MKEVESKEEILAKERMNAAVARLRQEKGEIGMYEKTIGIEDGMEACEILSYDLMKEIVTIGEIIRKNEILSLAHLHLLNRDDPEYYQTQGVRSDQHLANPQRFDHESYCEGWIQGVEQVWGQVKDHS